MKKIFTLILGLGALAAAAQTAPAEGIWYRIKSGEVGDRSNSYLGYYPEAGGVQGYVFSNTSNQLSSRNSLGYNPFICCGYPASPVAQDGREAASNDQVDAQLWQIIAGTGENAGKFALVNKRYPDGAICNVPVNNNGVVITEGATNASRWTYLENREENPEQVCWFTPKNVGTQDGGYYAAVLEFSNTVTPANIYMAMAKGGQNFQVMRYNTIGDAGVVDGYRWAFEEANSSTYSIVGSTEDSDATVSPEVIEGSVNFSEGATSYTINIYSPGCEIYYSVAETTAEAAQADEEPTYIKADASTLTLTVDKPSDVKWYTSILGENSEPTALSFKDPDGITSIAEVAVAEKSNDIYDLQGRKLAAPIKGINIIGGKKVLVK